MNENDSVMIAVANAMRPLIDGEFSLKYRDLKKVSHRFSTLGFSLSSHILHA